jgi:very-long-chain enoyl-CoA reductase
MLCT